MEYFTQTDLSLEIQAHLQKVPLDILQQASPRNFVWRAIYTKNNTQYDYEIKLKNGDFFFQEEDKHPFKPAYLYYKNLNIPSIVVKKVDIDVVSKAVVSQLNQYCSQQTLCNSNTTIVEVKAMRFEMGNMFPSPLKGNSSKQMINNFTHIKKLKFSETSYKRAKSRFFLMIAIYHECFTGKRDLQKLFLSPPIFLESRRKTYAERIINSKTSEGEQQSKYGLYDHFLPHLILIDYEKGVKCKETVEPISDDIEGLVDYLASPIIRNKIFHPLFLLWKFPNAVKLYYNTSKIIKQEAVSNEKNLDFFISLFKSIFIAISQTVNGQSSTLDSKPLILTLHLPHSNEYKSVKERISKYLKNLQGPVLNFYSFDFTEIPPQFQQLEYKEHHKQLYKRVYQHLSIVQFQRELDGEQQKLEKKCLYFENETQYTSVINYSANEFTPKQKKNLIHIPLQPYSQISHNLPNIISVKSHSQYQSETKLQDQNYSTNQQRHQSFPNLKSQTIFDKLNTSQSLRDIEILLQKQHQANCQNLISDSNQEQLKNQNYYAQDILGLSAKQKNAQNAKREPSQIQLLKQQFKQEQIMDQQSSYHLLNSHSQNHLIQKYPQLNSKFEQTQSVYFNKSLTRQDSLEHIVENSLQRRSSPQYIQGKGNTLNGIKDQFTPNSTLHSLTQLQQNPPNIMPELQERASSTTNSRGDISYNSYTSYMDISQQLTQKLGQQNSQKNSSHKIDIYNYLMKSRSNSIANKDVHQKLESKEKSINTKRSLFEVKVENDSDIEYIESASSSSKKIKA